jgi:diguanylate cyclase (GGDEF)-like protein
MRALFAALVFGLAAWGGIELTRLGGRIAALWPANAVMLAILMMAGRRAYFRHLVLAFAANVLADLLTGDNISIATALSACNTLEILAALLLMESNTPGDWRRLESPRVLLSFAIHVCIVAPVISGIAAAACMTWLSGASPTKVFAEWFMGDAMGLAIVTPPALILVRDGVRDLFSEPRRRATLTALVILMILSIVVLSQSRYPLLFLIFSGVTYVAFATEFSGAALGLLGVSFLTIVFTLLGHGPFVLIPHSTPREQVLVLQIFLLVAIATTFPIAALIGERKRMEATLRVIAGSDPLTGLANRAQLRETIAREWLAARRTGTAISMLVIDIDYFKRYNDTYGHLLGDSCLTRVADLIGQAAKRPSDLAGRYGGEEFVMLLPDTALSGAVQVADSVHRALAEASIEHEGSPKGRITVSIGVSSVLPGSQHTPEGLFNAADRALYRAKQAGRARTEVESMTDADIIAGSAVDNHPSRHHPRAVSAPAAEGDEPQRDRGGPGG